MLITKLTASKDLSPTESVDIETILREVKRHGFYSSYCENLVQAAETNEVLVREIRLLAAKALLRVTFNADHTICIFED